MRVGREEDDCITQQGVLFIGGRTPLGPAAPGVQRLGEAAALGAAPPPTLTLMGCDSPLGLGWQRLGGGSTRRLGLHLPKS
jgi:hypothetical protein